MKTLYININGEDIQSSENVMVVGTPKDNIIDKFYLLLDYILVINDLPNRPINNIFYYPSTNILPYLYQPSTIHLIISNYRFYMSTPTLHHFYSPSLLSNILALS